jgi:putative ABC transport system permease protein
MRSLRTVEPLLAYIRHAVRGLMRAPALALVAAGSLALGIGANTAVFAAADALFFAPAPGVANMGQLVEICRTTNGAGCDRLPYPAYLDLVARTKTLAGVYAVGIVPWAVSVDTPDGAQAAQAQFVSVTYFNILGARPQSGRFFSAIDERPGATLREVVLSAGYWRTAFRADPTIIGKSVHVNGDTYLVTGIAEPSFQGTNVFKPDLWVPIVANGRGTPSRQVLASREAVWIVMGGRLAPTMTMSQTRAEVDVLSAEHPIASTGDRLGVTVRPMHRMPAGLDGAVPFVAVLMGLVEVVLLIACTNLGGLLIARAASRAREVALRRALGASRGSLIAMFLIDGVVLFVPGALLAFLVATWVLRLADAMAPLLPLPVRSQFAIDWRVVAFTATVTLVMAVLTALIPALHATRGNMSADLRRDGAAQRRQRLRRFLVTAQIALCVVSIVLAGLLFRTMRNAAATDPGFQVDRIHVANIVLTLGGYTGAQAAPAVAALEDRIRAIPGVRSVASGAVVPVSDTTMSLGDLRRAGDPASSAMLGSGYTRRDNWSVVTPGYFSTLHIPLVRGRAFTTDDRADTLSVVVVNQCFADVMWPGQDPIGRRLEAGDFRPGREATIHPLTVVGVTRTTKYVSMDEAPSPVIYVPFTQRQFTHAYLFIEVEPNAPAAALAPALHAAVREVNPQLPVVGLAPLQQYVDVDLLPRRIAESLAGTLGASALMLAAIGLYGLTSFVVSSRTREIGVRVALGADRRVVLRLVLGQAIALAVVGAVTGLIMAAGASHLISSLLFGVSTYDPATFGLAASAVVAVTGLAAYWPARRAASLSPTVALRSE